MELHETAWNYMELHEKNMKNMTLTFSCCMEPHETAWNSMKQHGAAWNVFSISMELHETAWNCMKNHGHQLQSKKT